MSNTTAEPLMTVRDLAKRLGLKETAVRALVRHKLIGHTRIGQSRGRLRFSEADVSTYLEANHQGPKSRPVVTTKPKRIQPDRPYGF